MPRLLINGDGGGVEAIELRAGSNRLGRGPTNDFPIEHPTVSNTHCDVIWQDGSVVVRDCGSTNGTFIDNQPIKEALLKPGHTLQLGDVSMVLEVTPATVAIPSINFAEAPSALLADGSAPCLNHPQ